MFNLLQIIIVHAEGLRRKLDLLHEVPELKRIQRHELVHLVHARFAFIPGKAFGVERAAEAVAEEFGHVGEEGTV